MYLKKLKKDQETQKGPQIEPTGTLKGRQRGLQWDPERTQTRRDPEGTQKGPRRDPVGTQDGPRTDPGGKPVCRLNLGIISP